MHAATTQPATVFARTLPTSGAAEPAAMPATPSALWLVRLHYSRFSYNVSDQISLRCKTAAREACVQSSVSGSAGGT